jgi:mono/diheme cytochrome c family protein
MIDQFKEYFRLPSAKEMAAKELNEAQRKLLDALSAQEYAKRMADYHSDRIKRLTAYLKEEA